MAAQFSADMTGIKYTDLKIVRDETKAVVTVKSATVDKNDNTKVAIETYEALTDGKAYTVTYTATDEAKTESSAFFTATAGVVADIALNTYSVPANTLTEIKYQTLDADGVIIAEAGIGASAANNMEISVENFNGYQKNDELLIYKTGDKASVKVVYHTYKYNNTNGTEEGKVEKTFEITAVDPSSVIETYDYSVVSHPDNPVDFKRDTLVHQLAMEDDKETGKEPYAKFSFRKADGTNLTKSLDYTVESGNENVLLVSGTVAGGAKLTPVGVGATYLVIKNSSGNLITTLPITVVAKRELSTMTVDKSNVVVSENTNDSTGTQKITVTVMDQYSGYYADYDATYPELKSSAPANGTINFNLVPSGNKTIIEVTTSHVTPGTYFYTMDLLDGKKTSNVKKVSFSVTVSKQLAGNVSYALVMMNDTKDEIVSTIDTTVTADAYGSKTLIPVIVAKNNGSIVSNAAAEVTSIGALTLKKNGVTVDVKNGFYDGFGDNNSINNAAVYVATGDGYNDAIVKNLEPATYTVSLKAKIGGKIQNMSTSFKVEDSQKVFEADVKKESVSKDDANTLKEIFEKADLGYVSFSYAGESIDQNEYPYYYADSKYTEINANRIRVDHVLMDVRLAGTGDSRKLVRMKANVNRTFSFGTTIASNKDVASSKISAFNKKFFDKDGNFIGATGTATQSAVIASAAAIANISLTDGEKSSTGYYDVMYYAGKAAAGLVNAAIGGTNNVLSADLFTVLDVTASSASADLAKYEAELSAGTIKGSAYTVDTGADQLSAARDTLEEAIAYVQADANAATALAYVKARLVSDSAITGTGAAFKISLNVTNATVAVTASGITTGAGITTAEKVELSPAASVGEVGFEGIGFSSTTYTIVPTGGWVIVITGSATVGNTTVTVTKNDTQTVTYTCAYGTTGIWTAS